MAYDIGEAAGASWSRFTRWVRVQWSRASALDGREATRFLSGWLRPARWVLLWLALVIVGVFALTIGGAVLFSLRWGSLVEVTLGLAIGIGATLALGGLLVASILSALALRRIAQGTAGALSPQLESLRPMLVLPPPTVEQTSTSTRRERSRVDGELEMGPRLPGGDRWNPRVHNIGTGPALNGEARLQRQSVPGEAVILTIEPLGAGQYVDLASVELPRKPLDDLELAISYQDAFGRRFATKYRLYARGDREVFYWIGPADVSPVLTPGGTR